MLDRRSALKLTGTACTASLIAGKALAAPAVHAQATGSRSPSFMVSSTQSHRWAAQPAPLVQADDGDLFGRSFSVALDDPRQTMSGFGGAFSDMGWTALSALPEAERDRALDQVFGGGARLNHCRTPIGSSDMAASTYSYDEVAGDFDLKHFSLGQDRQTVLPFIKAAQQREPGLAVWASPWSPPTWMKTNGAFQQAQAWPGKPDNGVRPDQVRREGQDGFIQEPRYLEAYARYFGRYVDDYAAQGVPIKAVMPQNEFNSGQPYVSCVWTPEGLARFLPLLGREMDRRGVQVLFGTLERGNPDLVARVMADPAAAAVIRGIGVQWAGRAALPALAKAYPQLPLWGSEQECGVGTNDWQYARYNWRVLQDYLKHGVSVWTYWNIALPGGGESIAGWPQNSLIAIDMKARRWRLTHDYWALRHTSAYVRPGARYLPATSNIGYEYQTAFRNPDGSVVIVMMNDLAEAQDRKILLGSRQVSVRLPGDSFSTLVVSAQDLAG